MGIGKDLREFSVEEVKEWCAKKGLSPGRVRETKDGVYIVREGGSERIEEIDWDIFEEALKEKNLRVYGTEEGWMKIMSKR